MKPRIHLLLVLAVFACVLSSAIAGFPFPAANRVQVTTQTANVVLSALVSDAGSPEVNGTYTFRASVQCYNLVGQPDDATNSAIVVIFDHGSPSAWGLTDDTGNILYASPSGIPFPDYPWQATWLGNGGVGPPPTVTSVPAP